MIAFSSLSRPDLDLIWGLVVLHALHDILFAIYMDSLFAYIICDINELMNKVSLLFILYLWSHCFIADTLIHFFSGSWGGRVPGAC